MIALDTSQKKFNPPTVADGRVFLATFADPDHDQTDPNLVTPGKDCGGKDPDLSAMLNKPGWAWIIEYGLK
jgi:hypothetical protein